MWFYSSEITAVNNKVMVFVLNLQQKREFTPTTHTGGGVADACPPPNVNTALTIIAAYNLLVKSFLLAPD